MIVRLSSEQDSPTIIDRAAIFKTILDRQALRRAARLPPLDVPKLYRRAIELSLWQRHVALHLEQVQRQVLAQQRVKHGPQWPSSWGGRAVLLVLVQRELKFEFERTASSQALLQRSKT